MQNCESNSSKMNVSLCETKFFIYTENYCLGCNKVKNVLNTPYKCSICDTTFCSEKCKKKVKKNLNLHTECNAHFRDPHDKLIYKLYKLNQINADWMKKLKETTINNAEIKKHLDNAKLYHKKNPSFNYKEWETIYKKCYNLIYLIKTPIYCIPIGFAIFPNFNKPKHSCSPNSIYFTDFKGDKAIIKIKNIRELKEDEEVTISYITSKLLLEKTFIRNKIMNENFGFNCTCMRCKSDEDFSDINLLQEVDQIEKRNINKLLLEEKSNLILDKLLEIEKNHNISLPIIIYDVYTITYLSKMYAVEKYEKLLKEYFPDDSFYKDELKLSKKMIKFD